MNMNKDKIFENDKYIDYLYSEEKRPITDYPLKLAAHLKDHYYKGTGSLLDIGCGRGDMLKALFAAGYDISGVDLSPVSAEACKPHLVKTANLETDELPFEDSCFDYVFSKSVIEHLRNPTHFLHQSYRVLAPGGKAVIMTPSWVHNSWGPFYLDHTHVTPFTLPSLRDAMNMAGFQDVKVVHFYQLPFLWKRAWLKTLVKIVALLPIGYRPMHDSTLPASLNTFIRFSNEVMLLGLGVKAKHS